MKRWWGEFVESGRSQVEFCRERGIGLSTMQYWLKKAVEVEESEPGEVESGGFVEVRVEGGRARSGQKGSERQLPAGTPEYEIVLGDGKRLVVRSGFALPEVAALVALLEGQSW